MFNVVLRTQLFPRWGAQSSPVASSRGASWAPSAFVPGELCLRSEGHTRNLSSILGLGELKVGSESVLPLCTCVCVCVCACVCVCVCSYGRVGLE